MTDKNRNAFEAYFRACAIANGQTEASIVKALERAEDGTYMRALAYDGWCYWMAAKDFKAIDPQSKPSASRGLDAYYYGFAPTGCDLIDSVLESVATAGSGYHHTEDWREEYDDGGSPLSNMQKAADEAAAAVLALIAENERLVRRGQMLAEVGCEYCGGSGWVHRIDGECLVACDSCPAYELNCAKHELSQLQAEVAGLKTGYEAYERVNAGLKAEVERLTAHIADGMDCKAVVIQGMARLTAENEALRKERDKLAEDNQGLLEDFAGCL